MSRLLWLLWLLLALPGRADCLSEGPLPGVNLAGAEFKATALPGRINIDFVYPSNETLDYFRGKGMRLLRLPVTWERLQPETGGPLSPLHLGELQRLARYSALHDLCLLVDLHNFGKRQGLPLDQAPQAADALSDLWLRLAGALAEQQDHVALGLMNEPALIGRSQWVSLAGEVLTRLREAKVANLVVVSGGNWSGAHAWFSGSAAQPSNADLLAGWRDPLGRSVIELHQYADSDYSGTHNDCIDPQKMRSILRAAGEWGSQHGQRLLLGEFGVPASSGCLAVLDAMLAELTRAPWMGWAYWAGGPWWGSYPFSVQPSGDGQDKPQMAVLADYLAPVAGSQ